MNFMNCKNPATLAGRGREAARHGFKLGSEGSHTHFFSLLGQVAAELNPTGSEGGQQRGAPGSGSQHGPRAGRATWEVAALQCGEVRGPIGAQSCSFGEELNLNSGLEKSPKKSR